MRRPGALVLLSLCAMLFAAPASGATPVSPGQPVDRVYTSDIRAYVDGMPIDSYSIGGRTVVVCEDLVPYGFQVSWNGQARVLSVKTGPMPPSPPAWSRPQEPARHRGRDRLHLSIDDAALSPPQSASSEELSGVENRFWNVPGVRVSMSVNGRSVEAPRDASHGFYRTTLENGRTEYTTISGLYEYAYDTRTGTLSLAPAGGIDVPRGAVITVAIKPEIADADGSHPSTGFKIGFVPAE